MAAALTAACAEAGIDPDGARLLRMHSNTVFYLPAAQAVARIASSADAAGRIAASLEITEWLAKREFPTVRPRTLKAVDQGNLVVSFWEYEETIAADRSLPTLARLLRDLHAIRDAPLDLPPMPSPLGGVAAAVHSHPDAFDGNDHAWLSRKVEESERLWEGMRFSLPPGLIHGDAHPNNMLYTRRGVLLGDWDHVGYGPREWDLVQSVYFHRRFPVPGDDLDAAADVYGWDLRAWAGADDLVAIREISGLGAYIRTAAAKPKTRAELAYRISTLRDRDVTALWNSPSSS
jgi:aminoglycoside phosphotransferase (APT) family kinase protein